MPRIQLKNNQVLIVDDQEAKRVTGLVEELKEQGVNSPLSVTHNDGTWVGSVSDYSQTFFDTKNKSYTFGFKSVETLKEFHAKHGFCNKEKYLERYGIIDIPTQYLIDTKQAELVDNGFYYELKYLPMEADRRLKYAELWETYLANLDHNKNLVSFKLKL